jgi:hypothetical protein
MKPNNHFELRLERCPVRPRPGEESSTPPRLHLIPSIWIDGDLLDEPHAVSVNAVLQACTRPGRRRWGSDWHDIFICGCGNADCASINEGIGAVHEQDTVAWVFRRPQANRFGTNPQGYRQWCETARWHQFRFDRHQVNRELIRFLDEVWDLLSESPAEIADRPAVLGWFFDDPRVTMRYRSEEPDEMPGGA